MEETFGDLLYKAARNEDCSYLPSPAELKYKILVKGKKLKKDLEEDEDDDGEVTDEDEAADMDDEFKVSVGHVPPAMILCHITIESYNKSCDLSCGIL